jgi:hypothetical protein
VLREAFRPILPSFQSRLESVFSSNAASAIGPVKGSLEAISSVYDSTLRFLSLAYELVAGAFLDIVESGLAKKGDTGLQLYQDMQGVFLQVSSPFTMYAQRFAELEAKHTHVAASMISKDMQQVAGAISSNSGLQNLQEATARLKDLAPFIFPMVEGSLNRFELLNGGYRAGSAIEAIDKILSIHLGELVICIRSLSASVNADVNRVADDFDEQHVLCAMEVLKLAGNFRRDLRNFEGGTRDRMRALSERMGDYLEQEMELSKVIAAAKGGADSGGNAFSLPDSLSVVDIDSYLTKVFCDDDQSSENEDCASLLALQRLGSAVPDSLSSTESGLFKEAEESTKRLANSCHSFVLDICSAVPYRHLSGLPQIAAWREEVSTNAIDSYGTLPQQYITQVGEHMLALVQAFEPCAADPATLSVANEVMDGVRDVAIQPWRAFVAATGLMSTDSGIPPLMNGKDIVDLVLYNASLGDEDAQLEDGVTEDEFASAAFCNAWLDAIGLAVTGRLLERVMRISQLTPKGCDHLSADLNYLINVFSALGIAGHPHPLVSHIATVATLPDGELEAEIRSRNRNSVVENALRSVEMRLATLRGLSVS